MNTKVRIEGDDVVFDVVRTERIRMSQALRDFIRDIAARDTGLKIQAIKYVRLEYALGLKEAKDIVEGLTAGNVSSLGQLLRDKLDRDSVAA